MHSYLLLHQKHIDQVSTSVICYSSCCDYQPSYFKDYYRVVLLQINKIDRCTWPLWAAQCKGVHPQKESSTVKWVWFDRLSNIDTRAPTSPSRQARWMGKRLINTSSLGKSCFSPPDIRKQAIWYYCISLQCSRSLWGNWTFQIKGSRIGGATKPGLDCVDDRKQPCARAANARPVLL